MDPTAPCAFDRLFVSSTQPPATEASWQKGTRLFEQAQHFRGLAGSICEELHSRCWRLCFPICQKTFMRRCLLHLGRFGYRFFMHSATESQMLLHGQVRCGIFFSFWKVAFRFAKVVTPLVGRLGWYEEVIAPQKLPDQIRQFCFEWLWVRKNNPTNHSLRLCYMIFFFPQESVLPNLKYETTCNNIAAHF